MAGLVGGAGGWRVCAGGGAGPHGATPRTARGGRVPRNPEDAPAGGVEPGRANSSRSDPGQADPGPAVPVLSLHHAAKSFGAVRAVVDGSADLYPGEAHALLGENGAGKSTVVKMLAGVYQPDEGQVLIDGAPVTLHSPRPPGTPGSRS